MSLEVLEVSDHTEFMVAQYRREMPELGDLTAMETLSQLGEAARRVQREGVAPTIESFGLSPGEFDVLAASRRSGGDFVLTPTQLFEMTAVSSGGMAARLARMEKAGWIKREGNPYDRRSVIIVHTSDGKELIERALIGHLLNEEKIVRPLSRAEQAQLNALLSELLTHFAEPDRAQPRGLLIRRAGV